MATAFTQREREQIREALLQVALRYASQGGIRHVTVDAIAREAGISKGAFYSFFESKEYLFLAMVEAIHREMYGNAERILEKSQDMPIVDRVYMMVSEVYRVARERNVIGFVRSEVPLMLRRLPPEKTRKLYHDDGEYIRSLIEKGRFQLTTEIGTACTVVRLILSTLQTREEMGDHFDEAMKTIIQGSCRQLIQGFQ